MQDWIKFINTAFPLYETWINCFGEISGIPRINAAIDVFTDARIYTDFIQTKGIKLAVTMEMIKEMFKAAWMSESKIIKGNESKNMEKEIKATLRPILSRYLPEAETENALGKIYQINKVSFEAILIKGFEKINFTPDPSELKLFIKNRDSLVHQGRFYSETAREEDKEQCMPLNNYGEDYIFVSNFLTDVFLAIFGYEGRHGEILIVEHSL